MLIQENFGRHSGVVTVESSQWSRQSGVVTVESSQWSRHSGVVTVESSQWSPGKVFKMSWNLKKCSLENWKYRGNVLELP